MNATYCPEDNKLRIYPDGERVDSVLSETEYAEFKSAGYKLAAKQECFVCPRWTPTAEDWALELCGEIGDEDYSPEERAADRAERFEVYRDKRRSEAGGLADTFESGPQAFGHQNRQRAERQANRHDRYRTRAVTQWSKAEYWQSRTAGVIRNALYKSTAAVRRSRILRLEAEQRKHENGRAEYAARYHAWHKVLTLDGLDSPVINVRNSQMIGVAPETTQAARYAYALANNSYYGEYTHPRTGRRTSLYSLITDAQDPITAREAATIWLENARDPNDADSSSARWSEHYKLRLGYENAMLENEGGKASEAEIEPGGWIRTGNRTGSVFTNVKEGWKQVQSVNRSPATKRVVSVKVWGTESGFTSESNYTEYATRPALVSINIERLGEDCYRAPTDEERAAFAKETKERKTKEKASKPTAPPLINPTDADAERLQAIWNEHAKQRHIERKSYGEFVPSEVRRMTQAEYSARSKANGPCQTVDVSEQLKIRRQTAMGQDIAGRVTVFKVRSASGWYSSGAMTRRVVVLTDKPQKSIPWEAVDAEREQQPNRINLFVRMEQLAKACDLAWLPKHDSEEYQLLSDAVYVGWVYISSISQFGFTEEGRAVYNDYVKAKEKDAVAV